MKEINTKDMSAVQGGNAGLVRVALFILALLAPTQTGKDRNEK